MKWRGRRQSGNVSDIRGKGGAAAGGGLLFFGLAAVVYFLGGDPSQFVAEGLNRTVKSYSTARSNISEEEQDELAEFVSVVLAETEDTWNAKFAEQGGNYDEPTLVLFTGSVNSNCGMASSAVGPFYCPLDQKLYIDLDFFYELKARHDAPGDFAQAYVVAHEVGHHVQNLIGVLEQTHNAKRRASKTEANKISVRSELMADCFAGIWAHDAGRAGLLEGGDIEEALNAATQIGDDTMQKQAHGHVMPDNFTHGTGAQRYEWFKRGYETGNMDACNTFEQGI